jgi:hypothetical protein
MRKPPDWWFLIAVDLINFRLSYRQRIAKYQQTLVLWAIYFWSLFFSNGWNKFAAQYTWWYLIVAIPLMLSFYMMFRRESLIQKILDREQVIKGNSLMDGLSGFFMRIGMLVICIMLVWANHVRFFQSFGAIALFFAYILSHVNTYPRGPRGVKKAKDKRANLPLRFNLNPV